MKLNPAWVAEMESKLNFKQPIDVTLAYPTPQKWLIVQLTRRGIPFACLNVGVGVRRITTDTDKCPLCKRPIEKKT